MASRIPSEPKVVETDETTETSDGTSARSDPLRPSDHIDSTTPDERAGDDGSIAQPKLGPLGYVRFFWRQLTSMRTALVLLLLLALGAVPGSLVPQRSSDPNGVIQYQQNNPDTFKVLDALGLFSTFTSPWFSAIYLLLFVSLIGCIIPRLKHHLDALRAQPPKTPARLERLVGYRSTTTTTDAETAIAEARSLLKRQGYRVARYDLSDGQLSVSAERGYLRETGNLIFHIALVGMLLTVGVFGSFGYTGQRILVQGEAFTNLLTDYDSFNPGRFADENSLQPFQLRLDRFTPTYLFQGDGSWAPENFNAQIGTRTSGGAFTDETLKVNSPLSIGGTNVYLLGNGFAPVVTVKDPSGTVVFSGAVPFLAQDPNLTSAGVIKVPDGLAKQVAFQGFFCPTPVETPTGCSSVTPYNKDGELQLSIFTGDLGLNKGLAVNAYTLNEDKLTKVAGFGTDVAGLKLTEGQSAELPNGLGSIEFSGLKHYVSVDIHHDPTPQYALLFAMLILGGLLLSLFVPRRRVWIRAVPASDGRSKIEYAGLARGEDPTLARAVADLAARHGGYLDGLPEPSDAPGTQETPGNDPDSRT